MTTGMISKTGSSRGEVSELRGRIEKFGFGENN